MTTKQFANLAKGFLPELPDFVMHKKLVFQSPFGDILRGLYYEPSADAKCFYLSVFFLPLFVPTDSVHGTYGKRIGDALNWHLDNPNLGSDLHSVIRAEAIPFFNSVSTLTGVLAFLKSAIERNRPRVNSHVLEALAYTLIRVGDYSEALRALAEQRRLLESATVPWVLELKARAEIMEGKLSQDPDAALAQLEVWKVETVSKLGLQKYCKPNPIQH